MILVGHYSGKNLKLGTIADPGSVTSMAVTYGRVALLFNNGQIVVYEASNFDDNGTIIPVTVAQDAVHITYVPDEPTDIILVTRKDGTLWKTGDYQARWKLDEQISGLGSVERTAAYLDSDHFYVKRSDGSWVLYEDGDVTPVNVPRVEKVDIAISESLPYVGDRLKLSIQEKYTNGANIKVVPDATNVAIDKPHLLKLQQDGSFKTLGVGEVQVTVTTGGMSKTLKISTGLRNNLKYAKQIKGTVFVPAKSVIQALGGSVVAANGGFEARIGETVFSFKAGDTNAQLNGETVTLKAAPLVEKGDTYIPGTLLTAAVGSLVQWDNKWQSAIISFGDAMMTVVSTETAAIVKKAMQGSLAKYIGRSYWINYLEDWDRFSQVTVTDIVPKDSGDFVIQFKTASGKKLEGYPMSSSFVTEIFTDENYLFSYDPKKKYKWSAATWSQIKAGNVTLGMSKDQVRMSWGYPAGRSVNNTSGKTVETWVFSNFDAVSFVNGKVVFILD